MQVVNISQRSSSGGAEIRGLVTRWPRINFRQFPRNVLDEILDPRLQAHTLHQEILQRPSTKFPVHPKQLVDDLPGPFGELILRMGGGLKL